MTRIGRSVVTGIALAAALTVLGSAPSFAATTQGAKATHKKHACKAGEGKCQHAKRHAKHTAPKAASGDKAPAPTTAQ